MMWASKVRVLLCRGGVGLCLGSLKHPNSKTRKTSDRLVFLVFESSIVYYRNKCSYISTRNIKNQE